MVIASQLRKENIASYLLYMWQIEDLIRANGLDIDSIDDTIVKGFPEESRKHIHDWYESLIDMMLREDVAAKGHLQMNRNIIGALADLHRQIMADPDPDFDEYRREFYNTLPFIVELRSKSGDEKAGEIETCFNALYAQLLLRLQHKEISAETELAFKQISQFIALLARDFARDEREELFKNKDGDKDN